MKYILIIWVCSFIEGNGCMPPVQSPKVYDSWYECTLATQNEAIALTKKLGASFMNNYKAGVKYSCKASKVI
jgi:enhancing lycopene biosynthesis protein 2